MQFERRTEASGQPRLLRPDTGSEVKARDREIGGSEWAGEGSGTRELAASGDQMSKVGEEEQFLE